LKHGGDTSQLHKEHSKKVREGRFEDNPVSSGKSFRAALEGVKQGVVKGKVYKEKETTGVIGETSNAVQPLQLTPNKDFLKVLKGSFVGKLISGCKFKTIQLNLCLEGLRGIRVASLGDGRVVLFSEVGDDVGSAIARRNWWEGLLQDIIPWTPSVVSSKGEVWVRLYGIPLQLWDEQVFRAITKQWGEFIRLDEDTKGRVRFDRARVKLMSSVIGSIDFMQSIKVHGLAFIVRGLEESGSPLEFVHAHKEAVIP
jgi:hypothetical protein